MYELASLQEPAREIRTRALSNYSARLEQESHDLEEKPTRRRLGVNAVGEASKILRNGVVPFFSLARFPTPFWTAL
jgi:hypothetical protein